MTGSEITAFVLTAVACFILFRNLSAAAARRRRRAMLKKMEASVGAGLMPINVAREQLGLPALQARVVEVSVMPGAVMEQWCDDCNCTHRFVNVYAYEGDDPSTARRIGIAPVPDDYEDQDGGTA